VTKAENRDGGRSAQYSRRGLWRLAIAIGWRSWRSASRDAIATTSKNFDRTRRAQLASQCIHRARYTFHQNYMLLVYGSLSPGLLHPAGRFFRPVAELLLVAVDKFSECREVARGEAVGGVVEEGDDGGGAFDQALVEEVVDVVAWVAPEMVSCEQNSWVLLDQEFENGRVAVPRGVVESSPAQSRW